MVKLLEIFDAFLIKCRRLYLHAILYAGQLPSSVIDMPCAIDMSGIHHELTLEEGHIGPMLLNNDDAKPATGMIFPIRITHFM
jgi:hypothetical protein